MMNCVIADIILETEVIRRLELPFSFFVRGGGGRGRGGEADNEISVDKAVVAGEDNHRFLTRRRMKLAH